MNSADKMHKSLIIAQNPALFIYRVVKSFKNKHETNQREKTDTR